MRNSDVDGWDGRRGGERKEIELLIDMKREGKEPDCFLVFEILKRDKGRKTREKFKLDQEFGPRTIS